MPQYNMPQMDVANMASKLPRPFQWPAGAVMGGIQSLVGGNDPSSAIMGNIPGAPLMAGEASGPIKALMGMFGRKVAPEASQDLSRVVPDLIHPGPGPAQGSPTMEDAGALEGLLKYNLAKVPQAKALRPHAPIYNPENDMDRLHQIWAQDTVDQGARVRGTPGDIPDNPDAQALEQLRRRYNQWDGR